jgi:hypothetical protein
MPFKRLNSYSRQHPLNHALKELGKIPKSDFLLRYTDIVELRQAIEQQLNKGENVNKFARAVSFGSSQEFLYGEKIEQEIAEGCRRLIKNAIICWNYLYLTQKIAEAESEERRQELLMAVRNGSVVTWQHINLHGEYDFSDEKLQDSIGLQAPKLLAVNGINMEDVCALRDWSEMGSPTSYCVLGLLFNLTEPSMVVIDTPSPSRYVCPQSSGMRLGRRLARLWPPGNEMPMGKRS